MKAHGEEFVIGGFDTDDVELYEKGINRVGNLFIKNESYAKNCFYSITFGTVNRAGVDG
jgi:deoxyhypusine synthase